MSVHDSRLDPALRHRASMTPVHSPQPYPAEKARGAEIVLREPWQRAVFFGGLAAMVVLVLALLA